MFSLVDNNNTFFETWYEEFGQYFEQDKDAMKAAFLAGTVITAKVADDE